jgi:hypothetical protein
MGYATIHLTATLAAVAFAGVVPACAQPDDCEPNLPAAARELLASSFAQYRILELSDLNADDQLIWKSSYPNACPGVVQGAFTGEQTEYAVLLIPVGAARQDIRAVLLQTKDVGGMTQTEVFAERRSVNLPVIRRSAPGVYEDVQTGIALTASNDVVLIEHLESKVTALVFSQGEVRKLTLAE